jgi:hypothetical protein
MNRRRLFAAALLLVLGTAAAPAQKVFLWGNLRYHSGNPASGLEIHLLKGGSQRAKAYSNPAGRYAFFGQEGSPADYTLQVLHRQMAVSKVPVGGQVPDIVVD